MFALSFTAMAPNAYAQRHHVHGRVFVGPVFSPWFYYGPFGPYYDPFWYPYPYFYRPYGWYGYGDITSAVRIQVTPRDAKVYVDNYYAGIVDDYDGVFQRLRLPPGTHEIRLFLRGYRSITETVYLSPDSTYKITGEMTKLGPGEPEETPPAPPPAPPRAQAGEMPQGPPPGEPESGVSAMPPAPMPEPPPQPPGEPESAPGRFGRLAIRVQPAGAEVYIDGERWLTPETADRMVVNLAEGHHHIEIHKAGYDSFSTEVDVRRGQTTPLNVSLPERGQ